MRTQPVIEAILRERAGEVASMMVEHKKYGLPMEPLLRLAAAVQEAFEELGTCGQPNGECLCRCHLSPVPRAGLPTKEGETP